jgi:hypothetical protein
VAQACNHSCGGEGNQEDHSLRLAEAKSSQDPISIHGRVQWYVLVLSYAGKHK